MDLPPLSCGGISGAAAIAVDESDSAAGQVLLFGGVAEAFTLLSTVHLVDLATGACAPQQSNLLHPRAYLAAGRLLDARVVCVVGVGNHGVGSSAEVWGAPEQGAADAAWGWRVLPAMSEQRFGCCRCVMSDGRFAALSGKSSIVFATSSCEALVVNGGDPQWEPLSPMRGCRRVRHRRRWGWS